MAAACTPVPLDGGADTTLRAVTGTLHGYSVRETSGAAAAVLRLRCDSAAGRIVETVSLAAGESRSEYWEAGILCNAGIFEDWVSGAYEGTARVGDG